MNAEPKKGYKRYCLSLTGENSHTFDLYLGQGSLSIGTKGISKGEYDIWVEPDDVINWDAFNECYTEYGSRRKEEYPYGDWPRWFYYSGMDTGFIAWTSKRKTEDFYWIPTQDACVDFSKSMIRQLFLDLKTHMKITIGPDILKLSLHGDLKNVEIDSKGGNPILDFKMLGYSEPEKLYRIPEFRCLQDVESVYVEVSPVGDPFDCESLMQFGKLKHLQIVGNICHANALSDLKDLESLRLFNAPDLSDLPRLECWKQLDHFLGVDIDEIAGKDLKKQLKALEKERNIESHIAKLRSKTWFATEYENPFKDWEGKKGKSASKLYKEHLKEIKKAAEEDKVRELITHFAEAFNAFDDIDTVEREEIAEAVSKLVMASPFEITQSTWMQWFDEARDY